MIAVLIFVAVVLLIAVVNLVLGRRRVRKDVYDAMEDEEESDEAEEESNDADEEVDDADDEFEENEDDDLTYSEDADEDEEDEDDEEWQGFHGINDSVRMDLEDDMEDSRRQEEDDDHVTEELQRELEWLTISREQFFDSKSQLDSQGLTDIQRAARFFHIIKVSFGSDRRTFGTNKKNLANAIEYLPLIQKRLQGVVIENKDLKT